MYFSMQATVYLRITDFCPEADVYYGRLHVGIYSTRKDSTCCIMQQFGHQGGSTCKRRCLRIPCKSLLSGHVSDAWHQCTVACCTTAYFHRFSTCEPNLGWLHGTNANKLLEWLPHFVVKESNWCTIVPQQQLKAVDRHIKVAYVVHSEF